MCGVDIALKFIVIIIIIEILWPVYVSLSDCPPMTDCCIHHTVVVELRWSLFSIRLSFL